MNSYYIFLAIILVLMSVRNIRMFQNYKKEKNFINAYSALLKDEENAYENMKEYYQNEKVDYLLNKSKVLLAYAALNNSEDANDYLNDLNFEPLFTKKGAYDKDLTSRNLDAFIWTSMLIAKAKKENKIEIIEKVNEAMIKLDDILNRQVEYKVFKGCIAYGLDQKNEDYDFLKKLIEGEYSGLIYDKRMIGIFKRIAAVYLIKNNEELDDYTKNDIKEFGKTLVGKKIIDAIDLDEEYKISLTDSVNEEEKKENTEENK